MLLPITGLASQPRLDTANPMLTKGSWWDMASLAIGRRLAESHRDLHLGCSTLCIMRRTSS
jgi:hypothetical protein